MRLQDFAAAHALNRARPIEATASAMTKHALTFKAGTPDMQAHEGAFRYYLASEAVARAPDAEATEDLTGPWRQAVVPVVRGVIHYLWLVCLREMRHGTKAMCDRAFGKGVAKNTPAHTAVRHICETGDYMLGMNEFPDVSAADLAEAIRDHYYSGGWKGAYGGAAWGGIADVLVAYLRGEMSAMMATDRAWTLQHNTTTVFNKKIIWECSYGFLKRVLDAQAESSVLSAYDVVSLNESGAALILAERVGLTGSDPWEAPKPDGPPAGHLLCGLNVIPGEFAR